MPNIVGIELDAQRAQYCSERFANNSRIRVLNEDFLSDRPLRFDFILGSPPYVPITQLKQREKARYRKRYHAAEGRFDLYMLFFEQALRLLKDKGRLCFITPEKFLYVSSCRGLRKLLWQYNVENFTFLDEATYAPLITYPILTTLSALPASRSVAVKLRNGSTLDITPPKSGDSVLPLLSDLTMSTSKRPVLKDICSRISCGIATGADDIFVKQTALLSDALRPFAYPTVAGRDLLLNDSSIRSTASLLVPYSATGSLLNPEELDALGEYLSKKKIRSRLKRRTCARHKPWYAYHDPVPLSEILKPKILCKDICSAPEFWLDKQGIIVPRHSVYYLIPQTPYLLTDLFAYLNSQEAQTWLRANCQRAANGFIRLQSSVLKKLPIPHSFMSRSQLTFSEQKEDSRGALA